MFCIAKEYAVKSENQIKKMLNGYLVGRPSSKSRKFKDHTLFLQSDYGVITVYAIDKYCNILHEKKFYRSWFDAFIYYYNTLEKLI